MDRRGPVSLDVIIPLFNEEAMIEPLTAELSRVFSAEALAQKGVSRIRYVMIDDGSSDKTAVALSQKIATGLPGVLYRFSRNFGHQNALSAGFDHSDADLTAVIDADLQDPPELILQMLDRWREGFDVVYAQRRTRKESAFQAPRLLGILSAGPLSLRHRHFRSDSGDFCPNGSQSDQRAERSAGESTLCPLTARVGRLSPNSALGRPSRAACLSEAKYTISKLYQLATDGIASFSIRPLRIALVLGFSFFMLSAGLLAVLVIGWLIGASLPVPPPILVAYLLIVSGNAALCLCVYILGAYVGRSYLEVKRRPPYVIQEVIPHPSASATEK